jgi:hypothetical protein
MLLKKGDTLLVAHRRLFEQDEVRFFLGEVVDYEIGVVKIKGHSFVRDTTSGVFVKKADEQVKVLSLSSGTLLVYQLPDGVRVDSLRFNVKEPTVSLIDGKGFTMNLTEHTHAGQL